MNTQLEGGACRNFACRRFENRAAVHEGAPGTQPESYRESDPRLHNDRTQQFEPMRESIHFSERPSKSHFQKAAKAAHHEQVRLVRGAARRVRGAARRSPTRGMGERKRGRVEEGCNSTVHGHVVPGSGSVGPIGVDQTVCSSVALDTKMEEASAAEQRQQFLAAEHGAKLEVGTEWFVVSHQWLRHFKRYTSMLDASEGHVPPRPEEVDQRTILVEPFARRESDTVEVDETVEFVNALYTQTGVAVPVLRQGIVEGRDYDLITATQWHLLMQWYGGGPAISRRVVQGDQLFVDIFPLQVWVDVEGHDPRALLITRTQTMSLLVADLLKGVPDEVRDAGKAQEVRWFSTRSSQSWGIECSPSDRNTLEQHKISHHAVFRIGIQVRSDASDEESNKPPHRDLSPQTSPIVAETDSTMSGTADGWDDVRHCLVVESDKLHILPGGGTGPCIEEGRGLQGLVNLGNTCFMNSALQCLSNSRLLTEYFFSGSWRKELNTSNPLGMRGELAETYAGLLTRLWGQQASYAEDPSDLKRVIGCFAPQFTGYSQHDSQELLAFLLDGLHEDLNRIYNKPPTEVPSGDGTNDETIAAVAWERHRLRNDSVVQDLFAGQYRSKLQCSCSNVSVTFDPYNCVTLQLPQAHLAAVPLTFHPTHPLARPVKYVLRLSRYATMADLKVEVERLTETPAASLVVAEIFSCKFYHTFSDSEKVSLDGDTHVYAVSLPHGVEEVFCRVFGRPSAILCRDRARDRPKPDEPLASTVFLKLVHRKLRVSDANYGGSSGFVTFGTPGLALLHGQTPTYRQLRLAIVKAIRRFVHPPPGGNLVEELVGHGMTGLGGKPDSPLGSPPHGGAEAMDCDGAEPCGGGRARNWESELEREFPELLEDAFVIKLPGFRANRDVECDQDVGMLVSSAGDSLSVEVELEWLPHGLESVLNAAEFERVEEHASAQQCGPTEEMSLESCLQHFTTTEVLSDNDRWYCSKCKEHTRATKTMQLWSAPDYLIIHLKRFSDQDGVSLFSREKIDTLVKFPLEGLDLAPFVDSCRSASRPGSRQESAAIVPMLYDLYAVSNHFGGVGFGHYTSFCKSPADGKWRVFDDSSVSIVNFDSICTPAAYVLFYSLRQ